MKLYANKIAEMVGGLVEGNHLVYINKLSKIENGEHESLSFLGNPKYNQYLYTSKCSIILVEKDIKLDKPIDPTIIRVDDPNESFSILLNYFSSNKTQLIGIDKNSIIEKNVKYAEDLYLGSYSICKIDSKIGNNVKIHSQVFIGENVLIGDNTII